MKKILFNTCMIALLATLISCSSKKVSFENIQQMVYSNNFNFIAKDYTSRTTYSAPAGTGRIVSTTIQDGTSDKIGVQVNHDELRINLPINDKESKLDKTSLVALSQDFTVARKTLDNGNILLNFFLNDQTDINLVKMEVDKSGKIDCSIEGPNQKPLLFVGTIEKN
ncbi:DUF4251 domain-containing protein [Chryseobacterium sp. A301]